LRFLADECYPAQIVAALRKAGHDVRYVLETDRGAEDREVADLAAREDRVVVTEDYGFGELAVRERLPLPGVIILSFGRESNTIRASRAVQVVDDQGGDLIGSLTIIEFRRTRRRLIRNE